MEQDNLQQSEELNVNNNVSPETSNIETENEVSVQGQPAPIEKITVKEPPVWDFSSFNTEEIISHAKELITNFPVYQLKVLETLPQIFETQYEKEQEKARNEFVQAGHPVEEFNYPNDSKERFYGVYRQYREKKTAYYKKTEEEKEENLKIKLQIIEELKELVQKEESLNKTFQEFRSLQEKWRNTGMVPQANVNDLLETYHLHVENFYNYIKINKELRDLDLKKNLDSKINLCEQAEKLLEENNIGNAFKQLQQLHQQWKEIGPVPNDQKETIWDRFKEATNKINDAYHNFFESLKKEQENNLKIKEEICIKAENISTGEYNNLSSWNDATKAILELQEEWRHSGTIPQKERNKIYKRFRTACDAFFEKKRRFYQQTQEVQQKNLELKIALCEKVEAIQDSTEWRTTTDKIIAYQREWKKIGPAPKKYSNKVWNRFRTACDFFFNNKNAHLKNLDSDQQKNLEMKKALIEEVRNFTLSDNNEANIETLKNFQARWVEIGFVPIKEKDAIQAEFRNLLNSHFDQLDINEFDKNLEKFKSKVNTFDNSEDKDTKIIQEREKLVNKIKQLETDLHVWENNIGFFSKSSNSDSLIKEFSNKIEAARHKLSLMYEKLKVIDSMI
ncbi:DUF349 domain-containing protein [Gabonibacter massiliensis]|uniref:DUF349 domain-containing protein n=1 Tax=Gabonibacter massiliensis TaxID=1720195 RepID=UPI00073EB8B5|nr:DUF349 domain-containing protein [Gabonibacter massiliensis]